MLIERTSSGASFPLLPALRAVLLFPARAEGGLQPVGAWSCFLTVLSYSNLLFVV